KLDADRVERRADRLGELHAHGGEHGARAAEREEGAGEGRADALLAFGGTSTVLAAVGVELPEPVRAPFDAVGIELPNQPDDDGARDDRDATPADDDGRDGAPAGAPDERRSGDRDERGDRGRSGRPRGNARRGAGPKRPIKPSPPRRRAPGRPKTTPLPAPAPQPQPAPEPAPETTTTETTPSSK
ncbi:MAG TPA: hypothetical protein VHF89_12465, partial [Solirubrobacteraceae bacterium]|nr:hypothetical protein [Solirubrobacteraceae bacterium]